MFKTGFLALALLTGSATSAAVTLTFSAADIDIARTIDFNGFTDSYMGGSVATPGLTAQLVFTLRSIVGTDWTFDYSVANTSTAPIDTSRVSLFGFDASTAIDLGATSATGEFDRVRSGNVPLGFPNVDVCFATHNGGQCSGGAGGGVDMGEAAAIGSFTLGLGSSTLELALTNLIVRYQSLTSRALGFQGASGVGSAEDNAIEVPEPGVWVLMIAGFGLVGAAMRRRSVVPLAA